MKGKGEVSSIKWYGQEPKYYIHRKTGQTRDGEDIYQYMWRNGTWHDVCGSSNMWGSKTQAEMILQKYDGEDILSEELFEI